jgi:hypothetical protein
MAARFEFDSDAMEEILSLCDDMFEDHLGPAVKAQVMHNTPIDTGALIDSTYMEVDRSEHALNVGALGDGSRVAENRKYYAAWVDLGHRIFIYGRDTGRVQAPTAYMRRALYRRYAGF